MRHRSAPTRVFLFVEQAAHRLGGVVLREHARQGPVRQAEEFGHHVGARGDQLHELLARALHLAAMHAHQRAELGRLQRPHGGDPL